MKNVETYKYSLAEGTGFITMKKKILLPFDEYALPQTYHHLAFPMGIIQGNACTDVTPWLCGRYINCIFSPTIKNKFNICLQDAWAQEDKILFYQRIDLLRNIFANLNFDILSLIRKLLACHQYVSGIYNEEFIPHRFAYGVKYYSHDFLLIGYNDIDRIFYSVAYLKNGKYQRFEIPYENMMDAVTSLESPKVALAAWAYNTEATYPLDLQRIAVGLEDYINSENSLKQYNHPMACFGLSGILELKNYFVREAESGNIDLRYTRGLMEHKYFMQRRIEYLLSQGYLNRETFKTCSSDVYHLSEKVHLLGLKFSMTENRTIIGGIEKNMDDMIKIEKEYLPQVLEQVLFCQLKQRETLQ